MQPRGAGITPLSVSTAGDAAGLPGNGADPDVVDQPRRNQAGTWTPIDAATLTANHFDAGMV